MGGEGGGGSVVAPFSIQGEGGGRGDFVPTLISRGKEGGIVYPLFDPGGEKGRGGVPPFRFRGRGRKGGFVPLLRSRVEGRGGLYRCFDQGGRGGFFCTPFSMLCDKFLQDIRVILLICNGHFFIGFRFNCLRTYFLFPKHSKLLFFNIEIPIFLFFSPKVFVNMIFFLH